MALISMNVRPDDALAVDYDSSPVVYLNSEQCEALGLTTAPTAGTKVKLTCVAVFQTVTQNAPDGDGDMDICASLKITDMELGKAPSSSSPASLYSGDND